MMEMNNNFGEAGKEQLKELKKELGLIGGRHYKMHRLMIRYCYLGHLLDPIGYFEIAPLKDGFYVWINFADDKLNIIETVAKKCAHAKEVESFIYEHADYLDRDTARKLRKEQDELARRNKEAES